MGKVIGGIVGLVLGLLVSYLFKPATIFRVPSFSEWFTLGLRESQLQTTIAICGIVGAALGLDIFIDRTKPSAPANPGP